MNPIPTPRQRRGQYPQAWLLLASLCVLLTGCARPLPPLSPAEVRDQLLIHLQRIGDLSAYIMGRSESDGVIKVLTPGIDDLCIPPQKPTLLKQPLERDLMERVTGGMDLSNRFLNLNRQPRFEPYLERHQCSIHGKDVAPLLDLAQVQAQMDQELRELGGLSAYIASAERGEPVSIQDFSQVKTSCAPARPAVMPKQGWDRPVLAKVEQALASFNQDLTEHREPRYASVPPVARCE